MAKDWAGALGLWPTLLFSCLISHIGAPAVLDLQCHTDYAVEVVCHWDTMNTTDCAGEFQLDVMDSEDHKRECLLENRTVPESASPRCLCVIRETSFPGTEYKFSLEASRMNKSEKVQVDLRKIVKPRPLRNLRVTKSERQSFILSWEKSYDKSWILSGQEVLCQIQISAEGQKHPDLINLTEQTNHYEIFTDRLQPGENYTARIRYKITSGSLWSEWSPPCWWSNGPKHGDRLWWLVFLACFLVLVLVSACYCCVARLKRQWWDQIPSPKIGDDLGKKPCLVPWHILPRDEGKAPLCATSQDHVGRQLSFMDSLAKDGAFSPDEAAKLVPGSGPRGNWVAVLTPEAPFVEPSLTICSPITGPDPGTQEEEKEEEEVCVPHNDAAVLGLFLDLLGGGDSTEEAETPPPAWKELPPAGTPGLAGLRLPGVTPGKSPEVSSEAGYRNCSVAAPSQAASPAPEKPPADGQSVSSSQYKVLFPQQQLPGSPCRAVVTDRIESQGDGPDGSSATPTPPSCYKSFSSLRGQPPASCPQPWEHPPDFSRVDEAQPLSRWPPCREEGPFPPPQQEAASQNAPHLPDTCLPGYRPFRPASQGPSRPPSGSSPYKPLLEVFRSDPREGPREAEITSAWQGGPWEEPLAFAFRGCTEQKEEEEDSGQEGAGWGTECFLPQVPVAPL